MHTRKCQNIYHYLISRNRTYIKYTLLHANLFANISIVDIIIFNIILYVLPAERLHVLCNVFQQIIDEWVNQGICNPNF